MSSLGKACDPRGSTGVHTSGVCVCVCKCAYVLVEVYGKCGPESTWSPAMWAADWGKEEGHTRAGPP